MTEVESPLDVLRRRCRDDEGLLDLVREVLAIRHDVPVDSLDDPAAFDRLLAQDFATWKAGRTQ